MPRFRYSDSGDAQNNQSGYNDGRTQRSSYGQQGGYSNQQGSYSQGGYAQQNPYAQGAYSQQSNPYAQQGSGQRRQRHTSADGQARTSRHGAGSSRDARYSATEQQARRARRASASSQPDATSANPYSRSNAGRYAQQTGYAAQGNPYANGSYSSEDDYAYSDNNPYVSGPSNGAVNMGHQHIASYEQAQRRGGGKGRGNQKKRRRVPTGLVVFVVFFALVCGGLFLFFNPPLYNVNVNGTDHLVTMGTTIQKVIDEGFASPTAGNLLSVDGEVYTEGGGDAFEATINGTETTADASYVIPRGATVQIENGNDVTEDYDVTTETVAHGTSSTDSSSLSSYYNGAIHIYSKGQDGEQEVRTGKVSGKTVTTVTKQPVDEGYSSFSVDTNGDKVIALTFDDGPWGDTTTQILDILKEYDAKATFFEIGNQCAEYSDVVKRIASEGHQIATHSYDHASGSGQGVSLSIMSASEQVEEVTKGFQAIEDVLGTSVSRVLRAPGGNYYGDIITNLADYVDVEVGWDVDTEDWSKPGAQSIADAILSAQPGNVVLMHDGGGDRSQTVEALKIALPQLAEQGYKFVTIDELLTTYTSYTPSTGTSN